MRKNKLVVLHMGSDIRIPSNGIITVMKMILSSSILSEKYDLCTIPFSFPTLSRYHKVLGSIKAIPAFLMTVKKIHIVHIHHSTGFNFYMTGFFVFLSNVLKKKIVLHNHGADFKEFFYGQKTFGQWCIKKTFEHASAVILLSLSWQQWHAQNIGTKPRWTVIPNPTPLNQPDAPCRIMPDVGIVLYMSRLETRKGVYDLLDVIPRVVAEIPTITFVFAGDGDLDAVREKIEELNIRENVKLLGWVEKERKVDVLNNADIFILPSYNEGLPMALLEAMSFGIPSIATSVGGIPELIRDGENGIIIHPGDKRQLADALLALARDKKRRASIGQEAFTTIKSSFSISEYHCKLATLYTQIVNPKN